jgi:hypothetical protein
MRTSGIWGKLSRGCCKRLVQEQLGWGEELRVCIRRDFVESGERRTHWHLKTAWGNAKYQR